MIEEEPSPSQMTGDSLGKFSLLTVSVVTVLLTAGLIADRQKVTLALICGLTFFTLFGGMVIVVLSGQLTAIIVNHQKERRLRIRDQLHFSLYQPVLPAPIMTPQLPEVGDTMGERGEINYDPLSYPPPPHFVPAVPAVGDNIKVSAYEFVNNLFVDGSIDSKRVLPEGSRSPGQIQLKKPRPEVLEYLLSLGMVKTNEQRMLFFNVEQFPTLVHAKRAIKIGVKE